MYDRGFSIIEALIAVAITTMMLVTAYEFNSFSKYFFDRAKNTPLISEIAVDLSDRLRGYDVCFIDSHYATSTIEYIQLPFVTSAVGRSGYIFITTDSNVTADPDLYIFNGSTLVSSLSTGPGLRDIAVTPQYIYVANTSTLSQLQKINITTLTAPSVIGSFRFASTGNTVRYDQHKIYIGAEKAYSPELAVTNESLEPLYYYETDSQINDIYVTDRLYIAASNVNQLHIIGTTTTTFSPSGWSTQEGKTLEASGTQIYFGRTVGGFDNPHNHELFLLNATSTNLAMGVYGMVSTNDLLFIASKNLQVWKKPFQHLYDIPLPSDSVSLSCDKNKLIVGLRNGVALITFTYAN